MKRAARLLLHLALFSVVLGGSLGASCKREPAKPEPVSKTPVLRVFIATNVAGALEPCGCVKDMLGGVDHAAALASAAKKDARASLLVGAGPMLFLNPTLEEQRSVQDSWKAEALAQSLGDMGLAAWAPGANDWAAGVDELERLRLKSGAKLLAANVAGGKATELLDLGGVHVGIAGVSVPDDGSAPKATDPRPQLEAAKKSLEEQGAKVKIALLAMPRGDALRLIESVGGFQLAVIGKPIERGDTNDGPTPPVLLDDTLVVQTPNHLQGIAVVDFYVQGDNFHFKDGSGLANAEKRSALESRIADLKQSIAGAENARPEDVAARRADLEKLERELRALPVPPPPDKGSFFRYELEWVKEDRGSDHAVTSRLSAYYKRVNEHNKTAFADRKPQPVEKGQSSFVGIDKCATCHAEERAFWQGTAHSGAYATLARQNKQFNLDCVDCHVTGYEKPGGSTVTFVKNLENVQCEVCHGPGSRHVDAPKNKELIVAKPGKSLCAPACHHPPHVKNDWNVDAAWKKIIGPGHGK